MGVGFGVIDVCWLVSLDWGEEVGSCNDGDCFLGCPVCSVEDVGNGHEDRYCCVELGLFVDATVGGVDEGGFEGGSDVVDEVSIGVDE